jgi:putative ABC transport system permease protein
VLARLVALGLRLLRGASRRWPPAPYLAVRRIARYRTAVIGLVAASAVAAGVFGYAVTLNRSLAATLDAKAKTFIGSEVAVSVPSDEEVPSDLSDAATKVVAYSFSWIEGGGSGRDGVIVLAIDPATFERAAFWEPSFADASLGEVLDRLETPGSDGRVPAVVVGTEPPEGAQVGLFDQGTVRFPIEQVADVAAFPGMKRQTPTVIVAASALERLGVTGRTSGAVTEAWVRGDRGDVLSRLDAAGIELRETRRVDEVVDRASFLTVSWTFGFMRSLGIAAGLLTLGGLAVYVDARRRGRVLGYAFARRMGLRVGSHRRALVAELTASVVVGCWVGLGVALLGAGLAYGRIDPVPGFRPAPLLRLAVGTAVALAIVALVVAGLAAILAQRHTDRDDPVEVLRAGV